MKRDFGYCVSKLEWVRNGLYESHIWMIENYLTSADLYIMFAKSIFRNLINLFIQAGVILIMLFAFLAKVLSFGFSPGPPAGTEKSAIDQVS
jgi:hypothetical protein